jgi:hypothetical protein
LRRISRKNGPAKGKNSSLFSLEINYPFFITPNIFRASKMHAYIIEEAKVKEGLAVF